MIEIRDTVFSASAAEKLVYQQNHIWVVAFADDGLIQYEKEQVESYKRLSILRFVGDGFRYCPVFTPTNIHSDAPVLESIEQAIEAAQSDGYSVACIEKLEMLSAFTTHLTHYSREKAEEFIITSESASLVQSDGAIALGDAHTPEDHHFVIARKDETVITLTNVRSRGNDWFWRTIKVNDSEGMPKPSHAFDIAVRHALDNGYRVFVCDDAHEVAEMLNIVS